ncbi:MAG: UMP kinase [Nanoarchaeota archaeon]|nr:UMP kinase [Nanoarchaeota archaeon]
MKKIVISLGGSLIAPDKIDYKFLDQFKKITRKYYKKYKFIIVCGGGSIARKYIEALKKEKKSEFQLSNAGIRVTRMNALFMMQFFGKEANDKLPINMHEVKSNLNKNNIIFCGALRWSARSTSDTTAAKLANYLKTPLVNITNVKGLYTKDPNKNPDAAFIPHIGWKEFQKMALKIKHAPGQHFVLDQKASILINKHKIPTFILGKNLKNLEKILENKNFEGTIIRN